MQIAEDKDAKNKLPILLQVYDSVFAKANNTVHIDNELFQLSPLWIVYFRYMFLPESMLAVGAAFVRECFQL